MIKEITWRKEGYRRKHKKIVTVVHIRELRYYLKKYVHVRDVSQSRDQQTTALGQIWSEACFVTAYKRGMGFTFYIMVGEKVRKEW